MADASFLSMTSLLSVRLYQRCPGICRTDGYFACCLLIASIGPSRTGLAPLLGAEPHYFLLDQKVTKNQVRRNASFAAQGHCPAKPVKTRARSFCRLFSHKATASGKITNALADAQALRFLPSFVQKPSSDGFVERTKIS
jgi:hypothetical protein